VLLTRAPVYSGYCYPFLPDLHVLGTPPAFVLSQDQTLRRKVLNFVNVESDVCSIPPKRDKQGFKPSQIDSWLCTLFFKEHEKEKPSLQGLINIRNFEGRVKSFLPCHVKKECILSNSLPNSLIQRRPQRPQTARDPPFSSFRLLRPNQRLQWSFRLE
jgi:hypothetical protein